MRRYKLSRNAVRDKLIEQETFEQDTNLRFPWFQGEGPMEVQRHYAVCPYCDNPIRIKGLYKTMQISPHPFGQHTGKRINGFDYYNPDAYETCPYATKNRTGIAKKNRPLDDYARKIIEMVKDHFDRIIYVLRQDTGIRISNTLSERMLRKWFGACGYLYPGAHLKNLPWTVLHRAGTLNLYGQFIHNNEALIEAIKNKVYGVRVANDGRILNEPGKQCTIDFRFMIHKRKTDAEGHLHETIKLRVMSGEKNVVYDQVIEFRMEYFDYLAHVPSEKAVRSDSLLQIARTVYDDYSSNFNRC